ncbi:MAG: ABC-type multidrug transport system fused ATPase/permease subunit [Marinoscillum sp.]|jgi:ABC-type multidrug transport system fused ATPase/permease subunit
MTKETKKRLDREGLKNLLGIFQYVLPYKVTFIFGLLLLVASSSIFMVFPYVSGKLIDLASGKGDFTIGNFQVDSIQQAAVLLLGVLFVQSIVSFFRVLLFAKVTENSMASIRKDLYQKLISLPMVFFDKNRTGALISRISNDVTLLQDTLSVTLAELIRQCIILIVGITLIFLTTPSLSVFMLATFPVVVLLAFIFGKYIRRLSKRTQDQLAASNVIVDETLQSIHSVKAFATEAYESNRYANSLKGVVITALKVAWFRAGFISFIIFMLFGGIVAVMWYGAILVQSGDMTVGDLLSFVLYTTFIGASIAGIGDLFGQLQKAAGASERILEIHQETSEPYITSNTQSVKIKGNISFNDVGFTYPTRADVLVLEKLNFSIKAGEKIALVGHSGAGKSTIAQLLMRFYDVSQGSIEIDGLSLDKIDLISLRSQIGIVPQEVILFGGTIRENILYGKPEASNSEIEEAAKKANAWSFIEELPEKLDTLVGERGIKLSGGQRQRVAIARAVLKNPAILLLDEATSALDASSEKEVQDALNQLMIGRTTLIIAHRLATIQNVDKIYVLDKGQIVESGSHADLVKKQGGAYKKFIDLQMLATA